MGLGNFVEVSGTPIKEARRLFGNWIGCKKLGSFRDDQDQKDPIQRALFLYTDFYMQDYYIHQVHSLNTGNENNESLAPTLNLLLDSDSFASTRQEISHFEHELDLAVSGAAV
jgi:hypothetical protein